MRTSRRRSSNLVHQVHVEHLVKPELSANGTSALNESKPKAQPEFSASGTCRALSENEPEAKFEFSANGTSALNESKAKAQPEFSASGTCRVLSEA